MASASAPASPASAPASPARQGGLAARKSRPEPVVTHADGKLSSSASSSALGTSCLKITGHAMFDEPLSPLSPVVKKMPGKLQKGTSGDKLSMFTRTFSGCSVGSGSKAPVSDTKDKPMRRRVSWSALLTSSHTITPYGVKYGKHPSFFEFNRKGEMQLTDDGVADEIRQNEERLDSCSRPTT